MTNTLMNLEAWIGRTETCTDIATATQLASLAATLDRGDPMPMIGDEVPPLWHWLYFTPKTRASDIGADGHANRGGFLPPVQLPRRMWAGGRLQFRHPIRVGDELTRVSTVTDIRQREGRSGVLVFVTVRHEIRVAQGVALTEEHDIVYRNMPSAGLAPGTATSAPTDETFSREIVPDPVLLFRYSALTFNGHRIHYDRLYATAQEGYPGLVVHGPLLATLLLELARNEHPGRKIASFEFKALHPIFDMHPFRVCGRSVGDRHLALWVRDHEGRLAMQAHLEHSA